MQNIFRFHVLSCILFLLLVVALHTNQAVAETKTFIKEYTFQAGDEDSKNSSRVIALREVKRLLLEELGTYLESTTEVRNFQLSKDQIVTLSAGIVQTQLIEEKWDGKTYWLKAKISADADGVVRAIDALRKNRVKTQELEAMRRKSEELLREVEMLRREMAAQNGGREGRKAAYDASIRQLSAAEWIEKGHAVSGPRDKFQAAVEAYSRAIELDPANMQAYYFRARISEKNRALSDYYKILSLAAKTSEEHLIRAWTYKELEKRDAALSEFGQAIEKAAGNREKAAAYFDRGRYYFLFRPRPYVTGSGEDIPNAPELSLGDFNQAIALDPTDPSYFHNRANILLALGRYDAAISDLSAGLKIDPQSAGLYSARGHAYQFMKKDELAVADLSRAIELEGPDHLFAAHDFMLRASSYERMGKYDLALADWGIMAEKNPDNPYYLGEMSRLYVQTGKYDKAIQSYSRVLALKPESYLVRGAHYNRARAYALRGEAENAMQDLKKAIQLDAGYRNDARKDAAFASLRHRPDFIALVGK